MINRCLRPLVFFLALMGAGNALGQATGTVVGTVRGSAGEGLPGAVVSIDGTEIRVLTEDDGRYSIVVPANRPIALDFEFVGHQLLRKKLELKKDEAVQLDVQLSELNELMAVEVVDVISRSEIGGLVITPKDIERYPSTTGSLEQVLQYLAPGVSAGPGGELTSQYSVRGGNYDENLVYVNGFEIYRPFLVRTGQQEGLTFPNPNLTRALTFSSGGFQALYGDKLSSVLDVRYKRPEKFGASAEASFLGASAHLEGAFVKKKERGNANPQRFTYLLGARYKSTRYLLGSLDLKGEYVPEFWDLQANFTYDLGRRWQLEYLGNYNISRFSLLPRNLSSTTGLFNFALQLLADFEGGEVSDFTTTTHGAALTWQPRENLSMRLMASGFRSRENERVDIISYYRLNELETGLGDEGFGGVVGTLGYGETHQFIRNYLTATVFNASWIGSFEKKTDLLYRKKNGTLGNRTHGHFLQWGTRWQHEDIDDRLKEWERTDSLGYTLPYTTDSLIFPNVVKTDIALRSQRLSAFFQDSWTVSDDKKEIRLVMGLRAGWWDLNREVYVTPRAQFFYSPRIPRDSTRKLEGVTYKLAVGAYYQPPFYRELRNQIGVINRDVRAQKSIHAVGGVALDFSMWGGRKFKFIAEGYYKHLWDNIPFDVDNVRVRYYGDNLAQGYAAGLDLRLNGELVPEAESWINLGFLRTRERFDGVDHRVRSLGDSLGTPVGDVARPTDQAMILSMFFQDYLPKAKWLRVNLALTLGTGLPFGVPGNNVEYRNTYRFSPYHRVDIGFSASLWNRDQWEKRRAEGKKTRNPGPFLRHIKKMWLSLEVFNLLQVSNAASNTWVKDFSNISYAIPNYLTSGRVNLRFRVDF
jgi:hypothetical protein